MSKPLLAVLFIEDSEHDVEIVANRLRGVAEITSCDTRESFQAKLSTGDWAVILVDMRVHRFSGEEAMQLVRQTCPAVPVIIVTGSLTDEQATAALRNGAVDYLRKDRLERLPHAIQEAHKHAADKSKSLHAQRLELLGELSAGMIHDLNNVLQVELHGTEILRKRIHADDERILDGMRQSALHGAELTKQMLVFARGSNGSVLKPVTAEFVAGEIGQVLKSGAFPNIRATIKILPGTSKMLCNATQVHQVMVNLCVNARDAMPLGGQIDITAQNVFLHGESDPRELKGDFVMLTVHDSGPGMPPEVQAHIFDAFFTTKPKGKGTGMGLAIVKDIVESHGGAIDVQSTPTGTTFFVYLPSAEAPRPPEPQFDGAGKTILLAEDDATMRMFIALHLEGVGYKVLSACNGPEALAFFRENPTVDALVSDLSMPVMGGAALLDNIRAMGLDVPTIFVSGFDATLPIEPKPDGALQKPFSREQLLSELERVLA